VYFEISPQAASASPKGTGANVQRWNKAMGAESRS
jgi:hypothetical protein